METITPEEMALFKKLQEKMKAMKAGMSGRKDDLFQKLTEVFGSSVYAAKKDQITITTKEAYVDGNIYAISLTHEDVPLDSEGKPLPEIDTKALCINILENHLSDFEPIMGISSSLKITGTYEGKKLSWQVRKR